MGVNGTDYFRVAFHKIHKLMDTVKQYVTEKGYENKVSEASIDTSDPEQEFYLRQFSIFNEVITRIDLFIEYIDKPITAEGKLLKLSDGRYSLGDRIISSGDILEFMFRDKWEIGILHNDTERPGELVMRDIESKQYNVELDGLTVRTRN